MENSLFANFPLPKMVELRQSYPPPPRLDFDALLRDGLRDSGTLPTIRPGMRIAVGAGSRGIANLKEILRATVRALEDAGAKPFIVPAMGSHGGATPEGQIKVLAEYGVTRESMQVPFEASMEAVKIGSTSTGLDVFFSRPALQADGVVAVNRIKPHTDFRGAMGSGLQKMLVIGFGKQTGAANAHRAAAHDGYEPVLRSFAELILKSVPVLCGVAILEDQSHRTARVEVVNGAGLAEKENNLFQMAKGFMPRIPVDRIDLLIVDQIGKEISGSGMDTNVIGRDVLGYIGALHPNGEAKPHVARIFVRELTAATNGNGIGIGMADFTTARAVRALNLEYIYINALTSLSLSSVKIPMHFETDREVLQRAIGSLAAAPSAALRVVRIANTLELGRILVSEASAADASGRAGVTLHGSPREMEFDGAGNLAAL